MKKKFQKFIKFIKEVRIEMSKVTWPSKKEIYASTFMVIVSTLILAFFLGLVDYVLLQGIQPVLKGAPTYFSFITLGIFLALVFWIYKMIES